MMRLPFRQSGFTLVEMVMVIVITGIVGGMVAVFLQSPVQQYVDVARRADMTDIADTALRRITRDLRLALPNSVRVTGDCNTALPTSTCFIEFLPVKGGGRYRAGAGSTNDELDFGVVDGTFEVLGPMPNIAVGDQIVVYNLGISDLDMGSNAYDGNTTTAHNRRPVSEAGANIVTITSTKPLAFDSPGHRFHVITTPVSYVCDGAGTLWRYWGYAIQAAQSDTNSVAKLDALVTPATATRGKARLANNVSSCRFSYDAFVVAQRSSLVTMNLGITRDSETVTLYSATHLSNQP